MSQAVQNNNGKNNLAFSNVQAYTLAVITLAIGIAVGYFARGSAPVATTGAGESAPTASAPAGMGNAPVGSAQLPGIGSAQQQQAASPEVLAKAADPLLAQLKTNPKDFDNPDLLKLLFLKPALGKAQDERISEAVEFRAKQLHQKAEIGRIDILATRDNEVLAAVTGQIIRSGIFQDKAFTEAFPFTLRLRLIRNPNMALNGRFPTAVGDFKYEINR